MALLEPEIYRASEPPTVTFVSAWSLDSPAWLNLRMVLRRILTSLT